LVLAERGDATAGVIDDVVYQRACHPRGRAKLLAEGRWIKTLESGGHVRPPGDGVGQSAGIARMASTAFENERRIG
jgi:hypothetical protein